MRFLLCLLFPVSLLAQLPVERTFPGSGQLQIPVAVAFDAEGGFVRLADRLRPTTGDATVFAYFHDVAGDLVDSLEYAWPGERGHALGVYRAAQYWEIVVEYPTGNGQYQLGLLRYRPDTREVRLSLLHTPGTVSFDRAQLLSTDAGGLHLLLVNAAGDRMRRLYRSPGGTLIYVRDDMPPEPISDLRTHPPLLHLRTDGQLVVVWNTDAGVRATTYAADGNEQWSRLLAPFPDGARLQRVAALQPHAVDQLYLLGRLSAANHSNGRVRINSQGEVLDYRSVGCPDGGPSGGNAVLPLDLGYLDFPNKNTLFPIGYAYLPNTCTALPERVGTDVRAVGPRGRWLLWGSADNNTLRWTYGQRTTVIAGGDERFTAEVNSTGHRIAQLPNGELLVVGSYRDSLPERVELLFFSRAGQLLRRRVVPGARAPVRDLLVDPAGGFYVLDQSMQLHRFGTNGERLWWRTLPGIQDFNTRTYLSPTQLQLVNGAPLVLLDLHTIARIDPVTGGAQEWLTMSANEFILAWTALTDTVYLHTQRFDGAGISTPTLQYFDAQGLPARQRDFSWPTDGYTNRILDLYAAADGLRLLIYAGRNFTTSTQLNTVYEYQFTASLQLKNYLIHSAPYTSGIRVLPVDTHRRYVYGISILQQETPQDTLLLPLKASLAHACRLDDGRVAVTGTRDFGTHRSLYLGLTALAGLPDTTAVQPAVPTLYPNPSDGRFHLHLPAGLTERTPWTLFAITGQALRTGYLDPSPEPTLPYFHFPELPSGGYVLQISGSINCSVRLLIR